MSPWPRPSTSPRPVPDPSAWWVAQYAHLQDRVQRARQQGLTIVLGTGSRAWHQVAPLRRAVEALPPQSLVLDGDCRGFDRLLRHLAHHQGLATDCLPADWALGKRAGHLRNQALLDLGPTLLLAGPLASSVGTWDMIRRAARLGLAPTYVCEEV